MPIGQRDLRELLEARSRPALDRPIPWAALCVKESAVRRRRFTAFGAAVAVAGVTAVAVAASGTLAGSDKARLGTSDASLSGTATVADGLPAEYTEEDGTVYRRVATATLDGPREKSVKVHVAVSGKPLAILSDCPRDHHSNLVRIEARAEGASKPLSRSPDVALGCDTERAVDVGPIPAGVRRVSLSFGATLQRDSGQHAKVERWRFGVYEWTPPATMKAPPPVLEPPAVRKNKRGETEMTLIGKKSVTWPSSREVTITVPNTGKRILVVVNCRGDIVNRLTVESRVNRRPLYDLGNCRDGFPTSIGGTIPEKVPSSEKTVTFQIRLAPGVPEYLRRPGTITLALFEMNEDARFER
ncbi:hypothetical protein [Rhizohabitans arisaemae]|uniref:hypothetical protein n=1 Tax=Rhizohabitans arisaemae TaxID=2720610 RepID=UPI0024B0AE55|nr:hypothetical protein [Rhizohabitans arisaemae]